MTLCAACGHENPPGARFCNECGTPLGKSSTTIVRPAPEPRVYTPKHLAEKILNHRSALEGERKQVTVLFADVKESLDLSATVDPEEWHRLLDRFFAILAAGVHRFEGTINQFTGDGVMALFGAPIAHEDHAHRACHAALALRTELRRYADDVRRSHGLSFTVRMGLNSGEVVVGRIGDDLRMDYTAQGHIVGLAARMERLAEPGQAYLTGETAALVAGFFRLRDLGPFTIRGVREPVSVYELEGVGELRTRLEVARSRGFSRFVGRAAETERLERALGRALAGEGAVVDICADAGVGKSRLCHEFAERLRARGIPSYAGHGVAYGKLIPFLPVLEMFRSYFGVSERDGDQTAREKIAGRLILLDEGFRDTLPLWFDFLAVPDPARPVERMDPEARERRIFELIRRLVRARSRQAPAVILFEDLHWIDGATESYVANLVATVPGTRTLLITNFRPEYAPPWRDRPSVEAIRLEPLGGDAVGELCADLLGADPSLAGVAERIAERSAGNPFFVEELVQSLLENGTLEGAKGALRLARPADELALPSTIQALLASRIDRLGERDKALLQVAAVIGKEFSEIVLGRVAGIAEEELASGLDALVAAEFVHETAIHPERLFAFKHPLTLEVAYRSQLGDRRAKIHGAVARVIESVYADRSDERAALLAHHWENAGDLLAAARWLRRAAEWAGLSHPAESLSHWRKMRALLASGPASPDTVEMTLHADLNVLNFGWRAGMSDDEAAAVFAEGAGIARDAGDVRRLASFHNVYGIVRGLAGDIPRCLEHVQESVRLADHSEDVSMRIGLRVALVQSHLMSGDLRRSMAIASEALALSRNDPKLGAETCGFSPYVYFLATRAMLDAMTGGPHRAVKELGRVVEIARGLGETEVLGFAHGYLVSVAAALGDGPLGLQHAAQAVDIAEKLGSPFSRAWAYLELGIANNTSARWPDAVASLETALEIIRRRRIALHAEALALANLAAAHLGAGDGAAALDLAATAVKLAEDRETSLVAAHAHLVRARALRASGANAAELEAEIDRGLRLVALTGARLYEPDWRIELAEVARLRGDESRRAELIAEASRLSADFA